MSKDLFWLALVLLDLLQAGFWRRRSQRLEQRLKQQEWIIKGYMDRLEHHAPDAAEG